MKKIVSLLSAAAIVMTAGVPAVMAENVAEEIVASVPITAIDAAVPVSSTASESEIKPVLESVKQRIEISDEYTEFKSDKMTQNGIVFYSFSWTNPDKAGDSIHIQCASDGVITQYYNSLDNYYYSKSPYISNVTPADAKTRAEEFIETITPADFPYEIVVEDNDRYSLYSSGYNYTVNIYVNGVVFSDGNGNISLDKSTGEVTNFSIGYMPIEFPAIDKALTKEEAQKAYGEKLGLKLVYQSYIDDDGEEVFYPAYEQNYSYNKYINALNGEVFSRNNNRIMYDKAYGTTEANSSASDSGGVLRSWEIKELDKISGLISETDIEKQLRDNKLLSIPKEAVVNGISLTKIDNKEKAKYLYQVNMSVEDASIHATVNAQTGEIESYSRYSYRSFEDREFTYQNDDTFKKLAGDKASEYKYNEEEKSYTRYVNDVPVTSNTASVIYADDVLTNYYISYSEADFPSVDDVISVSEAEEAMFEQCEYEITYILNVEDNKYSAVPIYSLSGFSRINPFTGKLVDYKNEEITAGGEKLEYSDVSGHYAESQINELASYGVGFEGGKFEPNNKITQKDFLTLLMSTYQDGVIVLRADKEQADYVYGRTIAKNIISDDERDDDAIVTRENAAIYMIRAMGAEEYAKYNDIYVAPFKDVTANKGYVALLSAMGVVNGDENGNFNPNREITRAESVVMIHNYLTR